MIEHEAGVEEYLEEEGLGEPQPAAAADDDQQREPYEPSIPPDDVGAYNMDADGSLMPHQHRRRDGWTETSCAKFAATRVALNCYT